MIFLLSLFHPDTIDPEREMPAREDLDRSSRSSSKPRSPPELVRGERAAGSPPRGSSSDTRSRQRAPPVPKSYQKAVNREVLERWAFRLLHFTSSKLKVLSLWCSTESSASTLNPNSLSLRLSLNADRASPMGTSAQSDFELSLWTPCLFRLHI